MYSPIVLIGPMAAGKSTIANLLAAELNMERFGVDEHRWDYYKAQGYDFDEGKAIYEAGGSKALLQYWKPYEAGTVVKMLKDHPNTVMDFGAGHSVYEDEALFAKVESALRDLPNVVLLLPSPDLDKSVEICNQRFIAMQPPDGDPVDPEILELNGHFVKHPSNHKLAKITVYTEGKTPQQTCAEVIKKLVKVVE